MSGNSTLSPAYLIRRAKHFLRKQRRMFREAGMPNIEDLDISSLPIPQEVYFVVGHPKSGTTWLSLLLNNHPNIACLHEGHFFYRNDGFLSFYDALTNSDLLNHWMDRNYNHWVHDKEYELKVITKLAVQFYLQRECLVSGKSIVGDKSPSYMLKPIYDLFPQARIIHIIRDGRDVAVSMAYHRSKEDERWMTYEMSRRLDDEIKNSQITGRQICLPEDYLIRIANTWVSEVSTCRREGRQFFGNQYLEIRYEELNDKPEDVLKVVFNFLGASDSPKDISDCNKNSDFKILSGGRKKGEENVHSFFRKGISGDWKNVFRESDIEIYSRIAKDLIVELGYIER